MNKFAILLALGLTAGCMAEAPPQMEMAAAAPAEFDDRELAGRVAGAPVGCLAERTLRGPRAPAPGVLVWDGPGGVIYVNRTAGNCGNLRDKRSVRFRSNSSQLCRGDVAETFDPYTGVIGDFCNLGDFVPYRRAG